jgi:hypothetical protein
LRRVSARAECVGGGETGDHFHGLSGPSPRWVDRGQSGPCGMVGRADRGPVARDRCVVVAAVAISVDQEPNAARGRARGVSHSFRPCTSVRRRPMRALPGYQLAAPRRPAQRSTVRRRGGTSRPPRPAKAVRMVPVRLVLMLIVAGRHRLPFGDERYHAFCSSGNRSRHRGRLSCRWRRRPLRRAKRTSATRTVLSWIAWGTPR